jgi:hypothetical protein
MRSQWPNNSNGPTDASLLDRMTGTEPRPASSPAPEVSLFRCRPCPPALRPGVRTEPVSPSRGRSPAGTRPQGAARLDLRGRAGAQLAHARGGVQPSMRANAAVETTRGMFVRISATRARSGSVRGAQESVSAIDAPAAAFCTASQPFLAAALVS